MLNDADVQRRMVLSSTSNSKLTKEEQEELAKLQIGHARSVAEEFAALIAREISAAGIDLVEDFGYTARERLMDEIANQPLPSPDQIVPELYSSILQRVANAKIQANAVTREARKRADDLTSLRNSLTSIGLSMSVEDSQWRAEASVSPPLQSLTREANKAVSHAKYCEAAYQSVKETLFALNWMMENWDRIHLQRTTTLHPEGEVDNAHRDSVWSEPL